MITNSEETAYQEPRVGQSPDILMPGQQPPSQRQQNRGADRELPVATGRWTHPYHHQWDYAGQNQQLQVTLGSHSCDLGAMDYRILCNFYNCTTESILTSCITAWCGNCTALNHEALQRVVKTAQHITMMELPSMEDIYTPEYREKDNGIIRAPNHPNHKLAGDMPERTAASGPAPPGSGAA